MIHRKNIPKAVRRVFWRILFFYVLGALAIGVLVPYNDSRLLGAQESNAKGAAASPWVIAIYRAGIPALPSIINAVILSSASSSANAFLFTGSRYLYALAQNKQAPRFLLKCSKSYVLLLAKTELGGEREDADGCYSGVPVYCVAITASIGLLTFLSVGSGSTKVFAWVRRSHLRSFFDRTCILLIVVVPKSDHDRVTVHLGLH